MGERVRRFSMALVVMLLAAGCGGASDYELSAEEAACVAIHDEWPEEAARQGLVQCLENQGWLPIRPPPKPDFLTITSDLDPEDAYCRTRVWQHEVVVNPDMWGWESDPEGHTDEIAAVRAELQRCFDDDYYEGYGSRIRSLAEELYRDYQP